MGGEGSGRKPDPINQIKNQEHRVNIANVGGSEIYFPNYSGVKPEALKTDPTVLGGSTPAGNDTEVQYNKAGAFAGDEAFAYDDANKILTLGLPDSHGYNMAFVLVNGTGSSGGMYTNVDDALILDSAGDIVLQPSSSNVHMIGNLETDFQSAYKVLLGYGSTGGDGDALLQIRGEGQNGQSGMRLTNDTYGDWIFYTGVGGQDSVGIYSYTLSTDVFAFNNDGIVGAMGIFNSYPAYTLDVRQIGNSLGVLRLTAPSNQIAIGDTEFDGNSTLFTIDDDLQTFTFENGEMTVQNNLIAQSDVTVTGLMTSAQIIPSTTGGYLSNAANPGITGTMTTGSLVGKTLTFEDGIITGFA